MVDTPFQYELSPLPENFEIRPALFRVLLQIPRITAKTAAGIELIRDTTDATERVSVVGKILGIGPIAYQDPSRFGEGYAPEFGVGDWVIYKQYGGSPVDVKNDNGDIVRLKIMNDDDILARVSGPDAIRNYL